MEKSIKVLKTAGLFVPALAIAAVSTFVPAGAACDPDGTIGSGLECASGGGTITPLFGSGSVFTTIINVVLFVIGAISVIMLIVGGVRYTLSGGEAKAVESAKGTIMYAIIGIIIAALALSIVNFVLTSVVPGA